MNLGLAPNPPNSPNRPQSLGALGGLGGGSKLKSASLAPSPLLPDFDPHAIARAETALPISTDEDVETLALSLLAEAEASPAQTITDQAKALTYWRGEALRRLGLLRQRATDATTGEDIEREAIMAEETMPMAAPEAHKRGVAGLMLAALPLAGVPGALACRGCGRGIWCSPSWKGPPPPDLCFDCWREETI